VLSRSSTGHVVAWEGEGSRPGSGERGPGGKGGREEGAGREVYVVWTGEYKQSPARHTFNRCFTRVCRRGRGRRVVIGHARPWTPGLL
jgi:hypothetical protein